MTNKNVADSLEELNEKQRKSEPGWIGGLITEEDGDFIKSNLEQEYFEKLRKAYHVGLEMGFPTKRKDGIVNLEDYFDENLENVKNGKF